MGTLQVTSGGPWIDFDVYEILAAIGARGTESFWTVSGVVSEQEPLQATGDPASALEALAHSEERVTGVQLAIIAEKLRQVIWGEFKGYETAESAEPWITIVAFDSTRFDVHSDDETVLARIKSVLSGRL